MDVNKRDQDWNTPLSFAAVYGYHEVVKLLLDVEGIEVDCKDNNGRTPLSKAKNIYGREGIVRLLEKLGR